MRDHAFIFDIYGTLLEVGPPPANSDRGWVELWQTMFQRPPQLTRVEFSVACNQVIAKRHEHAKSRGIGYPEVCWPSVVAEALPELRNLAPGANDLFGSAFVKLGHTTRLAPGAADFLAWLIDGGAVLGIASNAQAYTLQELEDALATCSLGMSMFAPDLCFWSYQHGFSKPNPHVFQILTTRLAAKNIREQHVIMIGDRLDNDVEPARRHGWQAWQYQPTPERNWAALRRALESSVKTSPSR